MLIISHRGNINGITEHENKPKYLEDSFKIYNIHFECDIRLINGQFYLGHDNADYLINFDFINQYKDCFWHCKDSDSFSVLVDKKINCFYHADDDYTLTSRGIIWTHPKAKVLKNSIYVSIKEYEDIDCYGICTDYPIRYLKNLERK